MENSFLAKRAAKKKLLSQQLFSGLGKRNLQQSNSIITDENKVNQIQEKQSQGIKKSQDGTFQRRKERHKTQTKDKFEAKYEILEELGQGAHAVVKKCKKRQTTNSSLNNNSNSNNSNNQSQKNPNKFYAVKIMRSNDEEIINAAMTCYKLQKFLNHEYLCKNYELFVNEQNETIYQVMEYIEWPSLHKFAQNYPKNQIPQDIVKIIILQLLEATQYMHDKGICHRDLKPENILVNPKNNFKIKIIDFGIARKFLSRDPTNKFNILKHDMWSRTGTLCYKSPEMFSSANYTESCDMWSIGIISYEISTGKLPFYEEYQIDTIQKIEACDFKFEDVGDFKWKKNNECKDFVKRILKLENKRLTPNNALIHPYMSSVRKANNNLNTRAKDDVALKKSSENITFDLGQSTPAEDFLKLRQFGYSKSSKPKSSFSSNQNNGEKNIENGNKSKNQNGDNDSPSVSQSYNQIGQAQSTSTSMTQSQIGIFNDIHIIKNQNKFNSLLTANPNFINISPDVSQDGQSQPKTSCDFPQFDIARCESKGCSIDESEMFMQMRQPSTSISFPQDHVLCTSNRNSTSPQHSPHVHPSDNPQNNNNFQLQPNLIISKYKSNEGLCNSESELLEQTEIQKEIDIQKSSEQQQQQSQQQYGDLALKKAQSQKLNPSIVKGDLADDEQNIIQEEENEELSSSPIMKTNNFFQQSSEFKTSTIKLNKIVQDTQLEVQSLLQDKNCNGNESDQTEDSNTKK